MAVAVVLGVLAGAVSYLPHVVVTRKARTLVTAGNVAGQLGWFVLAVAVSFALLVVALVACKLAAPDVILPFAVAEIVTFVVVVVVAGFTGRNARKD